MRFYPTRKHYRYIELFSEIILITKGDFEYAHRAIRFLLNSGQIRRVIINDRVFYEVLYSVLELPIIRIQIVSNYVIKENVRKRKMYPDNFAEIRIFVYTKRPLNYGRRVDRFNIFLKELEEVEKSLFFSLIDAISKNKVNRVVGFEDTEISQKMFEEEKGVMDKFLGVGIIRKQEESLLYKIEKNGEWKIIKREEIFEELE